ncbi:EamA family transporter [Candidatus Roizmanbacteria bacterium]|nr:EamA family transporter [Candidatus Roizmanbacteria bacterium]
MNPILALIIANIIWGAASPIFKFSLENIPPFTLAFIRFFFAGLIIIPFALRQRQKISLQQYLHIFWIGFFGITINIAFFFLGLQRTESINVPVIASSGPLFIYLLSLVFLKEKPNLKIALGMLTGLAGVLIIILSPVLIDGKAISLGQIEGNLFILLATFGTVFQTVFSKNILKKVNPYTVSLISFFFGSFTFLPLALKELNTWGFNQLNFQGWTGIIFGVFFSSALAYFLYYYGISKLAAQEVGLFTYIDPVVAVLIAAPLLGEIPSLYYAIGSVLVFGGIYLAEGRIHWHPWHKLKVKS